MYRDPNPLYLMTRQTPVIRVWEGDYGTPSVDPVSLVLLSICKMHSINKKIVRAYFPFILDIPSVREESQVVFGEENVLNFAFKLCREDLHFSVRQQERIAVYRKYFMENFAMSFYFDCWIHETNYQHAIDTWFTHIIPFPFSIFYLNKKRREAQKKFDKIRNKLDADAYMRKKYEDAAVCLGDFNYMLKDNRKYIYQNIPTSLDAVVYSYIIIAMNIPLHNPTLQDLIYRHHWLILYVKRIHKEYFPNTPEKFKYVEPIYAAYNGISNKWLLISGICAATFMLFYAYSKSLIEFSKC